LADKDERQKEGVWGREGRGDLGEGEGQVLGSERFLKRGCGHRQSLKRAGCVYHMIEGVYAIGGCSVIIWWCSNRYEGEMGVARPQNVMSFLLRLFNRRCAVMKIIYDVAR